MNCADLDFDQISQPSFNFQGVKKDNYTKFKNLQSPRTAFNKKEKRNRKFFLKRSVFFVSICKQTGNIDFNLGSDLLHVEIMQGGHQPLNQLNIKDIKSQTFVNDDDFKEQNVESCLTLVSTQLIKKINQIKNIRCPQITSFCSLQNYQRLNENLKGNFTYNFDSQDWNYRAKTDKISDIEEAKKILKAQHQDIKKILFEK